MRHFLSLGCPHKRSKFPHCNLSIIRIFDKKSSLLRLNNIAKKVQQCTQCMCFKTIKHIVRVMDVRILRNFIISMGPVLC